MPDNKKGQNPQDPNNPGNPANPSNPDESCYSAFSDVLKNRVPDSVIFGLDDTLSQRTKDEIVDKDNNRASAAIIKTYTEHEIARLRRQKYLLFAIVLLTVAQLVFFNTIICVTIINSFRVAQLEMIDSDMVNNLFTILKYYIGATVVELLGMVWFITKGTFSTSHVKTMEIMLQRHLGKNL